MADAPALLGEPAHGGVRARGATGRGSDDHEGPLPVASVVLYSAAGCSLCAEALTILEGLREELGFALEVVNVEGDDALERRYRALLPVVEVDGEEAFVFEVDADALRERLAA